MKIGKIALILMILLACNLALSAAIPAAERQALIDLYNSTNGASWANKTNWLGAAGTENTWYGVTTDAGNTTVQQLKLQNNNLVGTLPSSLGNLSNLTNLGLNSNQLTGSIPTELGNLSNLSNLSLDHNELTGSIPSSLGSLSNLTYLALDSNQLTGNIPSSLGNLNNLQYLKLNSNQLTDSIPSSLTNLSNLQQICLYSNQLTGSIPSNLGNLSKLTSLWLHSNQLTGSIPSSLGNLNKLQALGLNSNQLTGSIPSSLGNLSDLINLYLCQNQLTGSIPTELGNLNNLQVFYLHSNQLTGSIPSSLGNLSKVTDLQIYSNQLTGSIPTELGNLSNLQKLYLFSNKLTGSIPSSLGNLSKLQALGLNSNQLTGSIPTSLTNLILLSSTQTHIEFNALHTSDAALISFLNSKDPNWAANQTIAPKGISAVPGSASVNVSWTPIIYTWDTGGYRIFYATVAGGPYTFYAQTTNKSASSQLVSGLTPGIPYYFVVQTRTYAHTYNQNVVDSENSDEVAATPAITIPATITVTSPNGGENWILGSWHAITWTSTGAIANVKIEYSADNGANWKTIIASTPNNGSYSWTPGSLTDPTLNTVSTTCLVRISDASNAAILDVSNAIFTLSDTGFISGSVTDLAGTPIQNILVQVYTLENVRVWVASDKAKTDANGQYIIPGLGTGSYKVLFQTNSQSQNYLYEWYNDKNHFNAADPVAVTVGSTTANINAQLGVAGIISGRVTDENGAGLAGVYAGAFSKGGFLAYWTATSDVNGYYQIKGVPAGNYSVMFILDGYPRKYSGNVDSPQSASYISVSNGVETPNIDVVMDRGGQIRGRVTDGSGNPVSGIQVIPYDAASNRYLGVSGGLTIANGTYSLVVRAGQTKVCFDTSVNPASGLRSQFFNNQNSHDTAGTVTVVKDQTTPNIDAVLAAGGGTLTINVTNSFGQGVPATIYLHEAVYETRMKLAVATNANGFLEIKGLLPGNYKVKVYDSLSDFGRYDMEWYNNAQTFGTATALSVTEGGNTAITVVLNDTYIPGTITVTSPNGGESWGVGSSHNITWTSTGLGAGAASAASSDIKIEYSTNGGTSYATIIASTANTGTYAWTVPNTPSTSCLVRVSAAAGGTAADVSDALFAIVANPAISGSVLTSGGVGIEGVVITFSNGGGTATTDAAGAYSRTVAYSWTGTAAPAKDAYLFNPSTRSYSDTRTSKSHQDYTAGYKPDTPTNFRASNITSSSITVAWSAPSLSNVDQYSLFSKKASESSWQETTCSGGIYSYTFGGLPAGTAYDLKIAAKNIFGSSSETSISANTLNNPPPMPTNLQVISSTYNSVNLSWSGSLRESESFSVFRRKSGETRAIEFKLISINLNDDSVTASSTYFYKVRVIGPKGNSDFTAEVSANTPARPMEIVFSSDYKILQARPDVEMVTNKATAVVIKARSVAGNPNITAQLFIDTLADYRSREIQLNPNVETEIRLYPTPSSLSTGSHNFKIDIMSDSQKIATFPNTGAITKNFVSTKNCKVLLVPTSSPGHGMDPQNVLGKIDTLRRFFSAAFPTAEGNVTFDISPNKCGLTYAPRDLTLWLAKRQFSIHFAPLLSTYDYIIAVLPDGAMGKSTGYAWYKDRMAFIESERDSIDGQGTVTRHYLAHEMGHLWGLYNDGEQYNKTGYPDNYLVQLDGCFSAYLPEYTFNLNSLDIMGKYGPTNWVIKSTYDDLISHSRNPAERKILKDQSAGRYIILAGWIDRQTDSANELSSFGYDGAYLPNLPENGDYSAVFVDSLGGALSTFSFKPSFQLSSGSTDEIDQAPFVFILPYPDGTKKIVINHNSTAIGTLSVSPSAPVVTITSPLQGLMLSGNVNLTWTGSDADDDLLKYNVFYSPDNGTSWMPLAASVDDTSLAWETSYAPGTIQGKIKVEASDGVNTSITISQGNFIIEKKAPFVGIGFPQSGDTLLTDTSYQFTASGTDLQDGNIAEDKYVWISDKDGELGKGSKVDIDCLSPGTHNITVIVTNSFGKTGQQTVSVSVMDGYKLIFQVLPAGSGTITVTPQKESYLPNTEVTLTANPKAGFLFQGWTGDISSNQISVAVTLNSNKTIIASFSSIIPPSISLSKTSLFFGAMGGATKTSDQQFRITNSGGGILEWSITDDANWLSCSPLSGTGNGVVTASIDSTGLTSGTYSAKITVGSSNAANPNQTIRVVLTVKTQGTSALPFGDFATPINGTAGVTGAIPVTGWVLDDIETTEVRIWRDPVSGEGNSQIYIGDAIFVEGARPDIETGYPDYPLNYRAGWGYMLLTNFLPAQGNGTFNIYAYAKDKEGNQTTLGTKTITCDNAHAVKPFGTIDTPTQGGSASGNPFLNFGWVLTPQTKTVPKDGSTIDVYVDSIKVGNLATAPNVYNQYRVDVATSFPGLNNSGGPVGAFFLDTTKLTNGVHTIYWIATDDQGAADGIGSRYFNIFNTGPAAQTSSQANNLEKADSYESVMSLPMSFEPRNMKKGFSLKADPEVLQPDNYGTIQIEIKEAERIELDLGKGSGYRGYVVVGSELRSLPIGSTLDQRNRTFSWMPGPGFLGTYDLVFVEVDAFGGARRIPVTLTIRPEFEK